MLLASAGRASARALLQPRSAVVGARLFSSETIPVNILKGKRTRAAKRGHCVIIAFSFSAAGQDPPKKPDAEYPEWLFEMKKPTMGELRKMEIEEMTPEHLQRFLKLSRRSGIKTVNETKSKKG